MQKSLRNKVRMGVGVMLAVAALGATGTRQAAAAELSPLSSHHGIHRIGMPGGNRIGLPGGESVGTDISIPGGHSVGTDGISMPGGN